MFNIRCSVKGWVVSETIHKSNSIVVKNVAGINSFCINGEPVCELLPEKVLQHVTDVLLILEYGWSVTVCNRVGYDVCILSPNNLINSVDDTPAYVHFEDNIIKSIKYYLDGELHCSFGAASITYNKNSVEYYYYYKGIVIPIELIDNELVDENNITSEALVTLALFRK